MPRFYVAAGLHGAYRGDVAADGTVTLHAINSGLVIREDVVGWGATTGPDGEPIWDDDVFDLNQPGDWRCSKVDRCGQISAIDYARIGGTEYLVAIHQNKQFRAHYALPDACAVGPTRMSWYRLHDTDDYVQAAIFDPRRAMPVGADRRAVG